jgi:hypothetical protein
MDDIPRRSLTVATLFTVLGWLVTVLGGLALIAAAVQKASRGESLTRSSSSSEPASTWA